MGLRLQGSREGLQLFGKGMSVFLFFFVVRLRLKVWIWGLFVGGLGELGVVDFFQGFGAQSCFCTRVLGWRGVFLSFGYEWNLDIVKECLLVAPVWILP